MAVEVSRRRFTADEFEAMGRAGILHPDDKVELIDGEVVTKMTQGTRHAAAIARLNRHFTRCVGDAAIVRPQLPVRLDLFNQPEPDLAVLRARADFFEAAHPAPADILLVIEVAESSIRFDQRVKAELYARLGAAEYWIVDLNDDVILRHADVVGGRYRLVETAPADQSFAPRLLPSCSLTTQDIFGPRA